MELAYKMDGFYWWEYAMSVTRAQMYGKFWMNIRDSWFRFRAKIIGSDMVENQVW